MRSKLKQISKQVGQGMTEYIIIVALIAIAAIGIYALFGETIQHQVGSMAQEIAGEQGDTSKAKGSADKAAGDAGKSSTLKSYTDN